MTDTEYTPYEADVDGTIPRKIPPPVCPCNKYVNCQECVGAVEKERKKMLSHPMWDIFVCSSPPSENVPCKGGQKCIVNHLTKSARRIAGELCFSMQEVRRIKESLRTKPEEPK